MLTSPIVALNYHTRPPVPYRESFDWLGLTNMTSNAVFSVVTDYETHALDLVNGDVLRFFPKDRILFVRQDRMHDAYNYR